MEHSSAAGLLSREKLDCSQPQFQGNFQFSRSRNARKHWDISLLAPVHYRSVQSRAYDKSRLVEADKLERILEAGRLAPSACNAQPWRFVVVTDPSLAEKVGKAAAGLGMNKFAKDAPVHILVVEESANITSRLGGKLKGKHFPLIDIGIVAAHMVLAAESEGLGSCILGWFDEKEIKSLTGIPSSKRVLLDILIGYPVKEKRKKIRKESGKIISYNSY